MRSIFPAIARQQKERARQPLLAGVEELIHQIRFDSDIPRQHERDETIGKLVLGVEHGPPEAFKPFVAMVKTGGLRGTLEAMLSDKSIYRSPNALGPAYERPENVTDETIEKYLRPFLATKQRTRDLERFVEAFDNKHTVAIEPKLKALKARTLIVWGTDDIYFDVKWSHWLADAIPGTQRRVEFKGARIFFPEERSEEFNRELRGFWKRTEQ
ncbi:MAG: alpha/beta hydrolase [Candidatus Acidiferrales bacterium]